MTYEQGTARSVLHEREREYFPHRPELTHDQSVSIKQINLVYGVIKGFPALRKAVTIHVKKYRIFSRVFNIANQLLTRHSPFALLGQVDE